MPVYFPQIRSCLDDDFAIPEMASDRTVGDAVETFS